MLDRMIRGLSGAILLSLLFAVAEGLNAQIVDVALYPQDGRRLMSEADTARFAGAGVLMCIPITGRWSAARLRG